MAIIQSGQLFSTYLTEQIEEENLTDELVVQGKLTLSEAEKRNEEWANVSVA